MFRERGKLDGARKGVNFAALAAALLVAGACGRPLRPVPPLQPRGDWPTVLGNAQRAGFAAERAPEAPEIVWRADVGRGLLTPLLAEGPVLIATTANRMVAVLDAETGEHYWERRLDGPVTGGAVRRGTRLVVATEDRDGKAYALGLERGRTAWDRSIGASPFPPLMVDGAAYFATAGGELVALAVEDGDELWRTELGAAAASTPVHHGDAILVATVRDTLYRLDRASGRIVGRAPLPATVSAAPALITDTLYLPLQTGDLVAYRLPDLEELWRAPFGAPILAAPVAGPNGSLYVLNRNAEVWRVRRGGRAGERIASLGGAARASLAVAQDRLLVGRLDGKLFLLEADGRVVWERDFDDSIVAPVTVADGALYVPLLRGTIVKLR
ncbi:MAG TPA: PQQ-binding-like beta-propeller repeat protein [Longimicrobiales bacterium]